MPPPPGDVLSPPGLPRSPEHAVRQSLTDAVQSLTDAVLTSDRSWAPDVALSAAVGGGTVCLWLVHTGAVRL